MALDPLRDPEASTRGSEKPRTLPEGTRIAAAVSSYHADLCGAMLESARKELFGRGLGDDALLVVPVPGAFELPIVAQRLAVREDIDAVLAFGLVLKGETPHDVYISQATCEGLMKVGLETGTPVLLGVLTCNTLEQARSRALPPESGGVEDKGREVAIAAAEVIHALDTAASAGRPSASLGFGSVTQGSTTPKRGESPR